MLPSYLLWNIVRTLFKSEFLRTYDHKSEFLGTYDHKSEFLRTYDHKSEFLRTYDHKSEFLRTYDHKSEFLRTYDHKWNCIVRIVLNLEVKQLTSLGTQLCLKTKLPLLNLRQFGHGVLELWSDIQTNKQRLLLYIYRIKCFYFLVGNW